MFWTFTVLFISALSYGFGSKAIIRRNHIFPSIIKIG